jgi:ABC-type molybdate transport system substrate-binding protein
MLSRSVSSMRSTLTSLAIIAVALGLAYTPIPSLRRTIIVVAGTELQEPLQALEKNFEQQHPSTQIELKFQGSQDIVNRYIDDKNDFQPTILIPANGEILQELSNRWKSQNAGSDPFYEAPQPIAKTRLVAVSWSDRGKALFPDGRFRWDKVEQAMEAGNWGKVGGSPSWGSFDFATTDPTRSNSGQLTLSLWSQAKLGKVPDVNTLNTPPIQSLLGLVKRSVYQPPRSTDVLLQEFITRGPNDADVAIVYESVALYRWQQSSKNQPNPYQIYYLDPTVETVSTAAIARRNVDGGTADAAKEFLTFLTQPEQQAVFVQYGFRPTAASVDLKSSSNSPWRQGVPGAKINPPGQIIPTPNAQLLNEVVRVWQRAN